MDTREILVFKAEEGDVSINVLHYLACHRYGGRKSTRQIFNAVVTWGGNYFQGESVHNPGDLFDQEKGIKMAIKHAIEGTGYALSGTECITLAPPGRKQVWDVFHKHYQFQKIAEGCRQLTGFTKTYGEDEYYKLKKAYGLEEAK